MTRLATAREGGTLNLRSSPSGASMSKDFILSLAFLTGMAPTFIKLCLAVLAFFRTSFKTSVETSPLPVQTAGSEAGSSPLTMSGSEEDFESLGAGCRPLAPTYLFSASVSGILCSLEVPSSGPGRRGPSPRVSLRDRPMMGIERECSRTTSSVHGGNKTVRKRRANKEFVERANARNAREISVRAEAHLRLQTRIERESPHLRRGGMPRPSRTLASAPKARSSQSWPCSSWACAFASRST